MNELVWKCPYCPSEKGWNAPSLSRCGDCGEKQPPSVILQTAPSWAYEAVPSAAKTRKGANKGKKAASKQTPKLRKKEDLETNFNTTWERYGTGAKVTRQYVVKSKRHFTPKRRDPKTYKLDFAWPTLLFAVEIQGGTYKNGGGAHNRGAGYAADRKRIRDLSLMGWTVWEYTTDDLQPSTIIATILEVNEKIDQLTPLEKVRAA